MFIFIAGVIFTLFSMTAFMAVLGIKSKREVTQDYLSRYDSLVELSDLPDYPHRKEDS